MKTAENRRKKFFANALHREIFTLIALASLLPAITVMILLYYLIFSVTANQIAIPEAIAYNIIPAAQKVTIILLSVAPALIITILIIAYKITHKIIGPFNRIIQELDEHLEGKKEGGITIRKPDKFSPLVERINKLLYSRRA